MFFWFPLGSGSSGSATFPPLLNPSFEDGLTSWTDVDTGGSGDWLTTTTRATAGSHSAYWQGGAGTGHAGGIESVLTNASVGAVTPGQFVTAGVDIALDTPDASQSRGEIRLYWYTSGDVFISYSAGNLIRGDSHGAWKHSQVIAPAPATAAKVKLAVWATANGAGGVAVDNASWRGP